MNTKRSVIFAIFGGTFIALTLLQWPAQAQTSTKSAPVTVMNTTANPVPVTGQIVVGSLPAVDAKQSGEWKVGITGTPTVGIDPANNKVLVFHRQQSTYDYKFSWANTSSPVSYDLSSELVGSTKVRLCVGDGAPLPITVRVNGVTSVDTFEFDAFIINSPGRVCNIYELWGNELQVVVENSGKNTTGDVRLIFVAN